MFLFSYMPTYTAMILPVKQLTKLRRSKFSDDKFAASLKVTSFSPWTERLHIKKGHLAYYEGPSCNLTAF